MTGTIYSKTEYMSACIVRVEGEIIKDKNSLQNLKKFLESRERPVWLVVSALKGIRNLISESIEQVFYSGAESEYIAVQLNNIWKEVTEIEPEGDFALETERLANLLKGIYLTGDYSPALKDAVNCQGEVVTALILVHVLNATGVHADLVTPAEIGLKATADFGNATFTSVDVKKITDRDVPVVGVIPGSYGITETGRLARSGKSAADYTAAFVAGESGADRLILWDATHHFYSADLHIVPDAPLINRLTYAEASELAYFDHFSLHPRTVEPLIKRHIPIHILQPKSETHEPVTIINTENFIAPNVVKSVACTDDITILQLNGPGVGLKPGILARITNKLAEASVNIKSVITSQVSINILLDRRSGRKAEHFAHELGFTAVSEIQLLEDVSLVAIVGHGMQTSPGISAKLFSALANNHVNVILSGSGASDLVSYMLVRSADRDKSVKAVFDAFFE